jgi:transcriptional regulator GlxA family with amidase domain
VIGKTVGDYHRELRLERARARLADPDCRIGQVAEEAGYTDAGSFSKAFRLRFGILPSEVPRPARSPLGVTHPGLRPESRERE